MQRIALDGHKRPKCGVASFTLVEMLTVIAIIAILASLVLYAASAVMQKAARNRATAEIQAMSAALENYKTDNGAYPTASSSSSTASSTLLTNNYISTDGTSVNYQTSSQVLFLALTGLTNFTDTPTTGTKSYISFKKNQIGSPTSASYVQDPWSYSYGYSTGSASSYPYNGSGFFDLWSTGGLITTSSNFTNTDTWLKNWN